MKNNLLNFILISIALLAFILRFWQYNQRYTIGYDSSRDALVSFESARQLQLPLTGSFSSIGPITFGPWYYYYIIVSNFIIPSEWASWMAIGLASFAMVIVMYKIGEILEGKDFGLLLSLIASLSPAQIVAASVLQQHALIGFLSSLAIYIFLKILKTEKPNKFALFWGLTLGLALNTHFQAVGLMILPFLYLIYLRKIKFFFLFSMGLFFSMIPILIFELNNHWFNTRNIIDYIFIGQYRVWTSNRWLTFIGKFWPEFWSYATGIPVKASFLVMIGSALFFLFKFTRRKLPLSLFIILLSFIVQVTILRYYRGEKFFGYLQFFHPYLFIFTGYLFYLILKKLKSKYVIISLFIIYLYVVSPGSLQYIREDSLNKQTASRMQTLTKAHPDQKFATFECKKTIYDIDRIQALLLFLYMHKLYDENGLKIAISNPACDYTNAEILPNDLVMVNNVPEDKLKSGGLEILTPLMVYNGTARWWFKEQP